MDEDDVGLLNVINQVTVYFNDETLESPQTHQPQSDRTHWRGIEMGTEVQRWAEATPPPSQ